MADNKIALVGYGKMGRMLDRLAPEFGLEVALRLKAVDNAGSGGITAGNFSEIAVAIDFSTPEAAPENLVRLAEIGVPAVCGTTGWLDHLERVRQAVERANIGLVYGANFSVGINAFYRIVETAARLMTAEAEYDAWAYEAHHKMKKDAPSGTMLRLLEAMKQAGYEKPVDLATNRAGYVPGVHEIGFDSEADTIRLSHTARSRAGFARGALRAARWIRGRTGLYDFSHVWDQMG